MKERLVDFIELDRRFWKLLPNEDPEKAALESYTRDLLGIDIGLGWKELLEHRLVVVLGEAGSGKTWEFRERVKILKTNGEIAFFIPLDRLIAQPLKEVLSNEDFNIFKKWSRGDESAFFFLDSVDEAKFHKISDFSAALDNFKKAIDSDYLTRMHILVSSRISEWRPQSDVYELLSRFQLPPIHKTKEQPVDSAASDVKSEEQNSLLIVQIAPLDRSRVEMVTLELGVNNPASFIRALDEHYAWQFARRPIDVIHLISYWKAYNKIGSLTELIEYSLDRNLKETVARAKQDRLTVEKARRGAEALGVAVVFCRNFNFRVPDDVCITDVSSIDSSECLPEDWTNDERYALLNRPIFDGASYGRIRFHHRRMAEYLAAKWLATRMKEGCSIPVLMDLLFAEIRGEKVMRPSLSPITAWLSIGEERWNEDIRNSVLKAAPWLHLRDGDPKQLPLDYRRRTLRALVERYGGREHTWIDAEPESLSRLADPGLSDDVTEIISNKGVSPDIRIAMLMLVRHGRLIGCVDAVLDIIEDTEEAEELKLYAAAAVRDIADDLHLKRLWEFAKYSPLIPAKLCAYICEALYPKIITAEGLVDIISKSDEVPNFSVSPHYLRKHLEDVTTPEMSGDLLYHLNRLLYQPPYIQINGKYIPISVHFYWIGEVIPTVIKKLFNNSSLTEVESRAAAESLWLLGFLNYTQIPPQHNLKAKLHALTRSHPKVRQHYFWRLIEERKKKGEDISNPMYLFSYLDVLEPMSADIEWAIEDIKTQKEESNQIIALNMAINLWNISGRKWHDRWRIRRAIGNNSVLLASFRQNAKWGPWTWAKILWYRHLKYRLTEKWWWRSHLEPIRQKCQWLHEEWVLLRNIRLLSTGAAINWLSHLVLEASENNSRWAPQTWGKLEQKRGRLITWAVRMGCKRTWENFVPLLPHEKSNPSQTDRRVIVGLAGLQTEFIDNELYATRLTEEEAQRAVRYAVNELNGFASWLPELAKHQPQAVCDVLLECIQGEWEFNEKQKHVHEVLSDLVWHGEEVIYLIKDKLLSELQLRDPLNPSILEQVLTLLLKAPGPPVEILSRLAAERIKQYPPSNRCFYLWLALWLQLDAEAALAFLQKIVETSPDADNIMIRLCSSLYYDSRHHLPSVSSPSYATPKILKHFIPIIYRHIRPSEDINRAGTGEYSPTDRDRAQRFRYGLLQLLGQSEQPEADQILHELLQEPSLMHLRDYILHILDERAERQADLPAWEPSDIRAFEKEYELDPKTDDDLFKIACRRLQDIKHDVEKADTSIRYEMHKDYDEPFLRNWLARKLQERARGRYTVPQEEEIDRQKRPDLRLENPRTRPVSIEIKWAENLTLQKLLERLENQLVGQYMRDNNSRYGVYLLCYIGKEGKHRWQDPHTKSNLGFNRVIDIIEKRAETIVRGRTDIGDIAVISIDFTEPR